MENNVVIKLPPELNPDEIRKDLLEIYKKLKNNPALSYDGDYDEDYYDDYDENYNEDSYETNEEIDESMEYLLNDTSENFENKVFGAIIERINGVNEKKRNFIIKIILSDSYECLKSREINKEKLGTDEKAIIEFLEIWKKESINKVNEDYNFFLDVLTVFILYHYYSASYENRLNNKEAIKNAGFSDELNVFGINQIDSFQKILKK